MNRWAWVLSIVGAAGSLCDAREIYVDASGSSGAADGSDAAPFKTLSEGLQQAAPGDTVVVGAGIYRESVRVPSGTPEKPLILKAAPNARVIVTGAVPLTSWTSEAPALP